MGCKDGCDTVEPAVVGRNSCIMSIDPCVEFLAWGMRGLGEIVGLFLACIGCLNGRSPAATLDLRLEGLVSMELKLPDRP
jgi:hypothetical protein